MINSAEVNQVLDGLERLRNAANVHTVNKAISYLTSLSADKRPWYLKSDEDRDAMLAGHLKNCRQAIVLGHVRILALTMKRWF